MAISHHRAWGWTRQAAAKLRRHWDEEKRALFDDGEVPGGSRIQEAGSFGQPFSARAEEAFSIISAKEVFGVSHGAGSSPGVTDDWLATISNQLDYFRGMLPISEVAKEPALAAKCWGWVASENLDSLSQSIASGIRNGDIEAGAGKELLGYFAAARLT